MFKLMFDGRNWCVIHSGRIIMKFADRRIAIRFLKFQAVKVKKGVDK